MPLTYLRLHLMFEKHDGRYFVRIVPPAEFLSNYPDAMREMKFGRSHYDDLVPKINKAVRKDDLTQGGATYAAIRDCGMWLDQSLRSAVGLDGCLSQALDVNSSGDIGLLVCLHFSQDAEDLSRLLWEAWNYAFGNARRFLIDLEWVSLVRYVAPSQATRRSRERRQERKLKLLVVTSTYDPLKGSPDRDLEEYVRQELDSMESSLAGLFEFVPLQNPTLNEMKKEVAEADIFHHLGHGGHDPRGGGAYMMLRDQRTGRGRRVHWDELHMCLGPHNAEYLKLVVLNACALQSLGFNLARLGIPGVITQQAEITAEAIADKEIGFTKTFYTHLAAGLPAHAAFTRARTGIRNFNSVEPFIPILILSTFDDISFRHPHQDEARHLIDPFRQDWDAAVRLEEAGRYAEALARLEAVREQSADYPGLADKLADIQKKIGRRKLVEDLTEQIETNVTSGDYGRLRDVLREVEPLAAEAALAGRLEWAVYQLQDALGELKRRAEWPEARRLCLTLRAAAALLPANKRLKVDCAGLEARAEKALAQQREQFKELAHFRRYSELSERAQAYLQFDPDNAEVQALLGEAKGVLSAAGRIRISDESHPDDELYERLRELANARDWRRLVEEAEGAMADAPPATQGELKRFSLFASAEIDREQGNWLNVKRLARDLLRLYPDDLDARRMLEESLFNEAMELMMKQRWDEADANGRELLQARIDGLSDPSGPSESEARRLLADIRLERARHAAQRHRWEDLLKAAKLLEERDVTSALTPDEKSEVAGLKQKADDALRLLRRIKVLT